MATPVSPAELANPETFAKRVRLGRTSAAWANTLLLLGIAGLLFKIVGTFNILSENPRANIWRAYFSTVGGDPVSTAWKVIIAWGPLVAIVVAGIFLLYSAATRSSAVKGAYDEFHARGYIARQVPTGLAFANGNKTVPLVVLSHPTVAPEAFDESVRALQHFAGSLDKRTASSTALSVQRAGASRGVPASTVLQGMPPGVLLSTLRPGPNVIVIPADPQRIGSRGRILPVKQ
jgi:hypothetical protein